MARVLRALSRVAAWLGALLAGLIAGAAAASDASRDGALTVGAFSTSGGELPAGWEHQTFSRVIPRGSSKGEPVTRYEMVRERRHWVVCASSESAASALRREVEVDLGAHPVLRWRWKVDAVLDEGAGDTRATDDYAARVYVIFDTDPSRLRWWQRVRLLAARALRSEVPAEALAYTWAGRLAPETIVDNPFAPGFVKMLAVESGAGRRGRWVDEERDVASDYRRAFGRTPSAVRGVALMTDTDDTHASVRACYGDLSFHPRAPPPPREGS